MIRALALISILASCSTSTPVLPGVRKDYMQGPSGSRLLIEENHDLPIVRFSVSLRTGGADDPPELDGLTNFSTELMARGAAGKSRSTIDAAFDRLGATLQIQTQYDGVHFEFTALKDNLDAAVALLADILLRPDFPKDEADKLLRETAAQLDELRDDDSLLARRFLSRRLFGDHPYGRTLTGTVATMKKLDVTAARAWHGRALRGPGVVIGVAGDIEPDAARALVERHLAALPAGDPTAFGRPHPFPAVRARTRLTIVDKPERTQSQLLFAHVAPNWNDADFDALQVAVHAFGGMFSSPLMDEVRAKRGLSYGASAMLGKGRGPRSLMMVVAPSLEQTAETVALVRKLFEDFAKNGLADDKIEFGRANLAESFAFSLATPEERLDLRITAELAGLPPDYVDRFVARVGAVTPAQARAAVARQLRPADLEIVIVATAKELRPRLEAAGLLHDVAVEVVAYDHD
jgi:zinc protease